MRFLLQCLLALAIIPSAVAAAQTQAPGDPPEVIPETLPTPPPEQSISLTPPENAAPPVDEELVVVQPTVTVGIQKSLDQFWGYRVSESAIGWIVGDGDQFGMVSLTSDHYVSGGVESGIGVGLGFHFLAGPERTDMPPRVYDFSIGYQKRKTLGDFSYDIAFGVRAASDFEGSSRDGVQFPCHAVGYLALTETIDLVLGADYLDRDDIHVLPVGGLIFRLDPDVRIELVFPSPRIDICLTEKQSLYLNGGFGGGTWAVERDSDLDDLATYFDLRIGVGLQHVDDDGDRSAIEIAYLFDRKLSYSSGMGDYRPNGTVLIRSVTNY